MKKSFLHLARLHDLSASDNRRMAAATLSHPQAEDSAPALIAALAICGVLGGISLLVPPFIDADSAYAFQAWRGTLLGAANYVITPDPKNIAQDTFEFLATYSPGQYLIPGMISLIGVPLGIAMTATVGLSMLAALMGWVMVVREFIPRTSLPLLVTVLIGSFRYSTAAFGIYHGGEILLQAATPWLILTAYLVPEMGAIPAALLAAGAVFLAFLAKLTGLIVVAAALGAGGLVSLAFGRRITHGMIGGALGALAALAIVYIAFLSRGPTGVSETSWSLPFKSIAFASLAPWVVGISWGEMMTTLFFPTRSYLYLPTALLAFLVPPAILMAGLVLFWRPQTANEKKFRLFSLWFYALVAAVFILLYIRGPITCEDRYFRSAGTLLFVCALISALAAGIPRWARGLFLALCVVMALYGLASYSHLAWTTADGQSLDTTSWTNQKFFDAAAIDFARDAYAHEGRDALFVLPTYQLVVTLPTEARILLVDLNWEPEWEFETLRYSGRVQDHIFVLMPNSICDTSKGRKLLMAFKDYPLDAWERKTFANMSVFFQ
jgi:hypothetical protein